MSEDLLQYSEYTYPNEVFYKGLDGLKWPYDRDLADMGLKEILNRMADAEEKKLRRKNKEALKALLETLDYVYVHGDKYVAIEDVLKLV